jgi:predicted RNase H-like nuclease (RuvC/YqgF family)
MILKSEFLHMVDRMGLEDGDLAIAEIVWQKAERAMQGKPVQEPVLTSSKLQDKLQDLLKSYTPTHRAVSLTTEELQSLTKGLSEVLSADEDALEFLKGRIDQLWHKSNPDDKDSETYFNMMNYYRNQQRKLKRQHKVLAGIQHKLKQARKL